VTTAARSAPVRSTRDAPLRNWLEQKGWKAAGFQREVWARYLRGESGLLVTPTGSGKTLAACGGPLLEALSRPPIPRAKRGVPKPSRLRMLWITPLRALAADTARALQQPVEALDLPWTVAMRTGDASNRDKRLARQGQAEIVVITPESLALQLSYADAAQVFSGLEAVIVDEWHELLENKRGTLLQLSLSQLRHWCPKMRIWGLSATLGNLDEARDVLLPHCPAAAIIKPPLTRPLRLETLVPKQLERFPWAGHLGLSQLAGVQQRIEQAATTLLFTNTRAQAELWHQALSSIWMHPASTLGLHHGSLSPALRGQVEQGLRDGSMRCVVATSSLDLGVDFPTVDQVIQIGSPKGIARLLQRAGRSRHRPGEAGELLAVPTHSLEVLEYAAARLALAQGWVEPRHPPALCLDVLAQHCVTLAVGGGFNASALYQRVRGTHAFAALEPVQWQAVLDFIVQGGRALEHYPAYHRVQREGERYWVEARRIAFLHRLNIGTITSDGHVQVRYLKGGMVGSVEESFVARLAPGDRFQFGGKTLELVQMKDMTAYVRQSKRGDGLVPRWQGGRLPLSTQLGRNVEALLGGAKTTGPEMSLIRPLLETQQRLSALPGTSTVLAEQHRTRNGHHLFVFLFAGRAVHEGIAALIALRLARRAPNSYAFSVNDYGLALTATKPIELSEALLQELLSVENLVEDLKAGMNMGELARRQFRDIARVAGLLPPSLPGRAARSMRQLQASSGLLYDVLKQHDPGHILLQQAEREVLELQLDVEQIAALLKETSQRRIVLQRPDRLTPLAFPLWAESIRGHLSSEDWKTRVQRAAQRLESADG
jgi:ATP-dependent Lhr-like helicase